MNRTLKHTTGILVLLLLLLPKAIAQQDSCIQKLASFAENINTFNRLFPQEKVYVHFDNTSYTMGETIWFKAYVVTAKLNRPTVLSTVLYVELLSPEGNIVDVQKLQIEKGQCHGSLQLKEAYYSGYYEVRAYTRCMLNFSEECLFSRFFPIYDKPKEEGKISMSMLHSRPSSQWVHDERIKANDPKKVNLAFFPEGGNLIKNIPSTIAFKATDQNGRGLSINGKIVDESGTEMTTLTSFHDGMGVCNFKPEKGPYHSLINYEGNVYRFNLPPILDEGYSVNVDNLQTDEVVVQLQKSNGSIQEKTGLAITCRGELYYFETTDIPVNGKTVKIPKKYIPMGVTQITLFNTNGAVLASRMVFINHQKQWTLKPDFDKKVYQAYDSIQLDFNIKNADGNPMETTFSLSVTDDSNGTGIAANDNIQTNLLLSSELKGYIKNPTYYFESNDWKHSKALDCLMLTQGWSRYSWEQMIGLEKPKIDFPIEKGLSIEGTASSVVGNKPADKVLVKMWLTTSDSLSQRGECITDENGRFNFLLQEFKGVANLSLQTVVNGKVTEMRIVLDRIPNIRPRTLNTLETEWKMVSDIMLPTKTILDTDTLPIPTIKDNHLLKEVTVTTKKTYDRLDEGVNKANIVYDVADEMDKLLDSKQNFSNMLLDFLVFKNTYFQFPSSIHLKKDASNYNDKEYYTDLDSNYTYKSRKVVFVVNNIRVVDDFRNRELPYLLTMDQIETITISEDPFLWQQYCSDVKPDIPHVVIFIYTNKDGKSRTAPIGMRKLKYNGFSQTHEFYSPNYRYGVLPAEKDIRRTLYWNPDVRTDKQGHARVQFFNNSNGTKMRISAETVTSDGTSISIFE